MWYWADTGRYCIFNFPQLCHVMQENWVEWTGKYNSPMQWTNDKAGGYHSQCVFVPRQVLMDAIAEVYSS
jgi:hypothetical protein